VILGGVGGPVDDSGSRLSGGLLWGVFPGRFSARSAADCDGVFRRGGVRVVMRLRSAGTCIRGLRIPVATVVAMVADWMTVDEILQDLQGLEAEDVAEVLRSTARGRHPH